METSQGAVAMNVKASVVSVPSLISGIGIISATTVKRDLKIGGLAYAGRSSLSLD